MGKIGPQTEADRRARDYSLPPGRFALGALEFERKTSDSSGQDYVRVKWILLYPKQRGKEKWFRATQSCNTSKEGAVSRWQWWMESLNITERFELGSVAEGTNKEGDANINRLFMCRGLVAEIGRETSNGYTNNDIKKFIKRTNWTVEELEAIEQWELMMADSAPTDQDDCEDPFGPQELPEPPPEDDAEFDDPVPPPAPKRGKKAKQDDEIPW